MTDKPMLINYNQLNSLWLKWVAQPANTHFDRWLKREASEWRRKHRETLPLALGEAMQHAQRFRQLACALELVHAQGLDQDWDTWAHAWQPHDADDLSRNNFWFWIQKRSHSQWYIPKDWQAGSRKTTVTDVEQYVRQHPDSALALLWYGLSPELKPALDARAARSEWTDKQRQSFISLQQTRPPLWLRPRLDQDPKALLASLKDEGVEAAINATGLCATGGFGLSQTSAFKEGLVEIQDQASQRICAAMDVQRGDKVWDACAGAGGKALALSDATQGKGVVVATDLHEYKLAELKKRAKRAGHANIRTFPWNGDAPLRLPAEVARQKGFDKVLVDAPCSATGTWRRNPDARDRLNDEQLNELNALQLTLLTHASEAVRAGGRLIYATCSWLVEENEDLVATFLEQVPGYTLLSQSMVGAPDIDTDTMFVAVMEKAKDN